MTKLTQRLFLVAVLNPNLGGCRQRAPYPLRPTRQERGGEDRRGRRALIWLRLFFGLIAAALFLAIFGPARRLAQISGWRLGRTLTVAFHRLLCFTVDARLRLHGAPSLAPRRLIVSNHVSWLDIPLLGAIEPMTFLAKKEVGGAFLGRQAALLQGIVFVDRQRKRGLPEVNANMARAMRAREPVLLFAEATTSDGNRLLRFRSSHFEAIRQARADGRRRIWRSGRAAGIPALFRARRPAGRPNRSPDRRLVRRHDVPAAPLALLARRRGDLRSLLWRSDPGSGGGGSQAVGPGDRTGGEAVSPKGRGWAAAAQLLLFLPNPKRAKNRRPCLETPYCPGLPRPLKRRTMQRN